MQFRVFQQKGGKLIKKGEINAKDGSEALSRAKDWALFKYSRGLAHWPIVEQKNPSKKSVTDEIIEELHRIQTEGVLGESTWATH